MIHNIITLTLNDLAIAFKNKTIYLIIFIPVFVFLSLKSVDHADGYFQKIKIGLVQKEAYPPVIIRSIKAADKIFVISWVSNEEEGRVWLKERKIDGVLIRCDTKTEGLALLVLKKESFQTLAIVEGLSALQKAVEKNSVNWISDVRPLQEGGAQKQTLPTWVLMLVLLVSVIIIPAQVAEEKEKKLILGLLQTPMREIEWLLAKLFLGMFLICMAVALFNMLGRFNSVNWLGYFAFICVGSFCFTAFGVFLGFLCRTQAAARTLGVLFYLPLLIPCALSDFSQKLNIIAPFVPSYYFYVPIASSLLENNRGANFFWEWFYLFFAGVLSYFLSYLLLKKRWLM